MAELIQQALNGNEIAAPANRARKSLHDRVRKVTTLRNRISNHEPLIGHDNLSDFSGSLVVDARDDAALRPEVIKWSRNLKRRLSQGRRETFAGRRIVRASYRPFARRWLYQSDLFIDETGVSAQIFPPGKTNAAICFSDIGSRTDYCVLAIDGLADLHFGAAVDAYQQAPRFRFVDGESEDNVTDWATNQFRTHYKARLEIVRSQRMLFSTMSTACSTIRSTARNTG
jgi:predicted helicase